MKMAQDYRATQPQAVSVGQEIEKLSPGKIVTTDGLDVKIFISLLNPVTLFSHQTGVRRTLLTIARELNVDEATVRNRFNRMRQDGRLRRVTVNINPAALGLADCHLRVRISPGCSKEEVIDGIKLLSGVYIVRNYFGGILGADFHSGHGRLLEKKVELIRKVTHSDNVSLVFIEHPPSDHRFSEADMRIIESVHESPFEPYVSIAKATGLSTKTVRRRFSEMLSDQAIFIALSLDYRVLRGVLKGDLLVAYEGVESKDRVDREVKEILDRRIPDLYYVNPGHQFYQLTLPNLFERREILRDVKSVRGVKAAYLDLVEERDELYDTYSEEIENKMLQVKASRPVHVH